MFLRWRGYDPRDGYLVQNELQAYLLQQPVSMAHAYFIDYTLAANVPVCIRNRLI